MPPDGIRLTKAEVSYSRLDYTVTWVQPILDLNNNFSAVLADLLKTLAPWNYSLDGLEIKAPSQKLADFSIVLQSPAAGGLNLSLSLGMSRLVFTSENMDWGDAERLSTAIGATLESIGRSKGAVVSAQQVFLGMHVQLLDRPRKELTANLVSPNVGGCFGAEPDFSGLILKFNESSIIVDSSLAYANGLYVRLIRDHSAGVNIEQIAERLMDDERRLFDFLGLEGIL